jgi:PKD repeat protein
VPLSARDNEAQPQISDLAGNQSDARINFTISVFRAIEDCGPLSGNAPLSVRYRTRAEFTGGSIIRYRWDFDGNGSFDTNDSVAGDYTRTWNTAGTIQSTLQVTNNFGQVATDTCIIQIGGNAPTATANASPSNGPIPLNTNFSCTGFDDGSIVLYEWDFEGNGSFDYSSPTAGTTAHTYTSAGTFEATCRVTDNEGLTGLARTSTTTIVPRPPGAPTVTATASPISGNTPLVVNFNGSANDGGVIDATIVLWEWDFDGDGVFDYSSPVSPATSHTYNEGGIFGATLRATDNDSDYSQDSLEIFADVTAGLSVPDDTLNLTGGPGDSVAINTTLSGTGRVKLFIQDTAGNRVRLLVDQTRTAGTYNDPWDGSDDAGELLPQGIYHAILEYQVGDEWRRVDLTNSTGGVRYNPSRRGLPSTFRPFEDDLLEITFTVPGSRGASEIQAFVGLFNTDTRIVTLLDRDPLGVGTHTIYWNGLDGDGNLAVAPPGDQFLFGIWGFTLPDNAIFIQAAPVLTDVTVDPNYFDPATPDFLTPDTPVATVNYRLDKTATVELTVTNLQTGSVVKRIRELIDPTPPGLDTFFNDDLEGGIGGWTHGGSQDEWELGTPSSGPGGANSGVNAWSTDLNSSYNNGTDAWLMSPSISLPKASELRFWHYFDSESYYDGGIVEVSTDNGASFSRIAPTGRYPYTGIRFGGNAYSGSLGEQEQVFDLAAYTGQTIRIRFRMITDGSITRSGWTIDDVVVGESLPLLSIAWDGHADSGLFADAGDYRLELRAIDSSGNVSLTRYALARVFY